MKNVQKLSRMTDPIKDSIHSTTYGSYVQLHKVDKLKIIHP